MSLTSEFKNPGIGNVGALWSLKTSENFLFGYFRARTWQISCPAGRRRFRRSHKENCIIALRGCGAVSRLTREFQHSATGARNGSSRTRRFRGGREFGGNLPRVSCIYLWLPSFVAPGISSRAFPYLSISDTIRL